MDSPKLIPDYEEARARKRRLYDFGPVALWICAVMSYIVIGLVVEEMLYDRGWDFRSAKRASVFWAKAVAIPFSGAGIAIGSYAVVRKHCSLACAIGVGLNVMVMLYAFRR